MVEARISAPPAQVSTSGTPFQPLTHPRTPTRTHTYAHTTACKKHSSTIHPPTHAPPSLMSSFVLPCRHLQSRQSCGILIVQFKSGRAQASWHTRCSLARNQCKTRDTARQIQSLDAHVHTHIHEHTNIHTHVHHHPHSACHSRLDRCLKGFTRFEADGLDHGAIRYLLTFGTLQLVPDNVTRFFPPQIHRDCLGSRHTHPHTPTWFTRSHDSRSC